jgi:hypothetical protein
MAKRVPIKIIGDITLRHISKMSKESSYKNHFIHENTFRLFLYQKIKGKNYENNINIVFV